jgi:arylsulfatase A-like enzyme
VKEDDRDDVPPFAWYLHWKLPEPRLKFLKEANQWKNLVRAYLASISLGDHLLGRVLDQLKASGFDDNTIIIVWSDHGWHLGEKGITGKNTLWERSTHVPLIFAGPGIAHGRCTHPAELLDLYPTLCELTGAPIPEGVEGHSLMPQLKDPIAPREWPAITTHGQNNHTVRTDRYRYIRYADGSEEFYDMQSDPNEWTNLAKDPKCADLIQQHRKWLPRVNVLPIPGSKTRLVELRPDGTIWWEGQQVKPGEAIPQ